jgi:hypothetical protein
MLGVLLVLQLWAGNTAAVTVAVFGFGTLWLRLWLERAERPTRLRTRRTVIAVAVALVALLLSQRGGAPVIENVLTDWWPAWLATWRLWWWNVALAATVVGAGLFLTAARATLRTYLWANYSSRAMLAGATIAALVSLFIFGPPGPPLIGLYTLGAVMYEALGMAANQSQKPS